MRGSQAAVSAVALLFVLWLGHAGRSWAWETQWGAFDVSINNRISLGGAWRVEDRDPNLIGKLNLNPHLCDGDDCLSLEGDPEPNRRLVNAPGAFSGHNNDDGNMNYDKGDAVAAVAKLTTDINVMWEDLVFKARGIAFYDEVNTDFEETHFNTTYQPGKTKRDGRLEELVGNDVELAELYLSGSYYIGGRALGFTIGQQKIPWGVANLVALNGINEWNPPDARRLHQPGFQLNELHRPIPAALVSFDLTPNLTLEGVYQFGWEPVVADPAGSFFGPADQLYRENAYGLAGMGQFPEDPDGQHRLQHPLAALVTDTSFTNVLLPDREPEDGGQFGARLTWFAEEINNGTEFGFYAMNYHSRLPYGSGIAADRSCLRDMQTDNVAEAFVVCRGFSGLLSGGTGEEPLLLDTAKLFLEYPEDIRMFGASFATNIGAWAVSGEYAYRPDMPTQVSLIDVGFAALQPGTPDRDIVIGLEGLTQLALLSGVDDLVGLLLGSAGLPLGFPVTIPSGQRLIPDYLQTRYRGQTAVAGQYVRGYEELDAHQLSVSGLRLFGSSNPLKADTIILMLELGMMFYPDMPSLDVLQFEGGSPQNTHYSPGADGTGGGAMDTSRFNPTQQTDGFADDFSMGYRALLRLEYNDVIWGMSLNPMLVLFHDVKGTAPLPVQNFLEDRIEAVFGLEVLKGQHWGGMLTYQYLDGDEHNPVRDRDNISFSISYTF